MCLYFFFTNTQEEFIHTNETISLVLEPKAITKAPFHPGAARVTIRTSLPEISDPVPDTCVTRGAPNPLPSLRQPFPSLSVSSHIARVSRCE